MKTKVKNAEKLERARLKKIYKVTGDDDCRWGLIKEAARLKVALDDAWNDICEKGYTESFQQTEKCAPYERERPVVKQYQAFNKQYQTIIRQLNETIKGEEEPLASIADLLD